MAQAKMWMTECRYEMGGVVLPVRGVVMATTRKKAEEGALESCEKGAASLGIDKLRGKRVGEPQVLYAIG